MSLDQRNIVREGRKWLQVGKDNEMMQALKDTQLN